MSTRDDAALTDGERLTSTSLLARNVLLNLAGWVVPVVLALLAVPVLSRQYGPERFGLLNLAWSAVGYFSVFDLGLGRAVTQLLAARLGRGKASVVNEIVWTALALLIPLSLAATVAGLAAASTIAAYVAPDSTALRGEAVASVRLLALAIPTTVLTTILRGVLEAGQRFGAINALRVPLGVLTFGAPLVTLLFSSNVAHAIALLVAGRGVLCAAHAWLCVRAFPTLVVATRARAVLARRLATIGGWITVSNVVNPLLVSMDRVVISSSLGLAAVGYYAAPQEIVTKMWLFTSALLPVVFPAFAATFRRAPERSAVLFDRAARLTLVLLLPVAALLAMFAREGLELWLGAEFARAGAPVLRILVVAVYCNCVGQAAYTALQAAGRPRVTALSHLAQLPLFFGALTWATSRWGLVGAAAAWSARIIVDSAVCFVAVAALLPTIRAAAVRAGVYTAAAMLCLAAVALPMTLGQKFVLVAAAAPAYAFIAWTRLLTDTERSMLLSRLRLRTA